MTLGAVVVAGGLIALSASRPGLAESTDYSGMTQDIQQSGAIGFAIGSPDAPVTLVEYSDFSCSHCYELAPTIHRLISEFVQGGQLRIVYKPISFVRPPYSTEAAKAAVCAAEQGQFWQLHDQMWSKFETAGPGAYTRSSLTALAGQIGLDSGSFGQCFGSAQTAAAVEGVLTEAEALGVNGTPTLFVNGQRVAFNGPDATYIALKTAIQGVLGE
jgi:protein-disulfide isomerase